MTNHRIADGLAVDSRIDSLSCVDLAYRIEKALNKAEREGFELCKSQMEPLVEALRLVKFQTCPACDCFDIAKEALSQWEKLQEEK